MTPTHLSTPAYAPDSSRPRIDVSHLPDIGFDWRAPLWWGNLLGVIIETVSVALLLAAYFYLARNFPEFPPPRVDTLPPIYDPVPALGAATANTALLVLSCAAMYWTDTMARRKDQRRTLTGLGVMMAVAALSLVLHWYEFPGLYFKWNDNAYGSITWTLLGLHFIYVTAGLLEFLLMALYLLVHHIDNKHALDVTLAGGYWYWTAGIWVLIYATVYFAPRLL